ncbi:FecR family protein [Chryseobacterium gleum]|uniref:FecR family protein n=1 Tax=Chryseobacterium gleum TaxID=250 RepID=UPI00241E0975|nr:FecR family protein [Chryseobacterium gleum]
MKTPKDIQPIFEKYLSGTASKEEYYKLLEYFSTNGHKEDIHSLILKEMQKDADTDDSDGLKQTLALADGHINKMLWKSDKKKPAIQRLWVYIPAAMVIVAGLMAYFFLILQKENQESLAQNPIADIRPGTHKATLTLSSGESYHLKEDSKAIETDRDGIHYADGERITGLSTETVTLHTPAAGEYRIILPDGTSVFLNAESSITYPGAFTGSFREVSVKGEVYFKVAHNASMPFIVKCQGQEIKVLGTTFNIYSYPGEAIATTLVEGKVKVGTSFENKEIHLMPGEQSVMSGRSLYKRKVRVSDYIGWTRNLFIFNDTRLSEIMKQISRWYDVEVIYPKDFKDESFFAEIPRDRNLSEVLKALEHSGHLTFLREGRRIMVRQ